MFGIDIIDDGTKVLGDNNLVTNCSYPESTLSKKHHSIHRHYVRKFVAVGVELLFKVDTEKNLDDIFTKVLSEIKRREILTRINY